MTYEEALAALNSLIDYEKAAQGPKSLSPYLSLLETLGHPEERVGRVVSLVGTKGKGSTAEHISQALVNEGVNVGAFTSPHLLDVRERIRVNGKMLPGADFAGGYERVAAATGERRGFRTYFETLSAMALLWFAQRGVEVVLQEAGLGGRLDCVNALSPEVVVVTPVGLDHTHILGETVKEIAGEKAAVIKPGCTAVSAPQTPEAAQVLRERAEETGAPLRMLRPGEVEVLELSLDGARFLLDDRDYFTPLLGRHQAENAALAALALKAMGFEEPDFTGLSLPGRLQVVRAEPPLVLDIAHNPLGLSALALALRELFPGAGFRVIFALSRDKDAPACLRAIAPAASELAFTQSRVPRSEEPSVLAARCGFSGRAFEGLQEAYRSAPAAPTLITGSTYLVADALQFLQEGTFED